MARSPPRTEAPPLLNWNRSPRKRSAHLAQTPACSPLRELLLRTAPGPDFTDKLRFELEMVQFQQGIRHDMYGVATADEFPIGRTPTEVREAMIAAANSIFDSNSDSDSSTFSDTAPRRPAIRSTLHAAGRNRELLSITMVEDQKRSAIPDDCPSPSSCSSECMPRKAPARGEAPTGKRKRTDASSRQGQAARKRGATSGRPRTALTGNEPAEAS